MGIEFNNVCKEYKKNVFGLRDVNLSIDTGIFGLIGRNGAGKTTLMRLLATILEPTKGNIYYEGKDIKEYGDKLRGDLGYLPQNTRLQASLSAFEFLDYIGMLKGFKDKNERKKEVLKALEIVGLESEMNKKLSAFSGGMLRRAGIAQSILGDPKLIIVDEPTVGLDPEERLYFRNLLARIGKNRTVILSTHIISDIESICENIGILDNGSLVYNGGVSGLIDTVKGRVWEFEVDFGKEESLKNKYTIISNSYLNDKVKVRYVTSKNEETCATNKEGTLEDAYIYMIGGLKR